MFGAVVLLFEQLLFEQRSADSFLFFVGEPGLFLEFFDRLVDPSVAFRLLGARRPIDQLAQENRFLDAEESRQRRIVSHWPTETLQRKAEGQRRIVISH